MSMFVSTIKPFILKIATHPSVKNLVIDLLYKYVKTTDNSIDDVIVTTIKELMFKPQP
jgi:hypothetical protein